MGATENPSRSDSATVVLRGWSWSRREPARAAVVIGGGSLLAVGVAVLSGQAWLAVIGIGGSIGGYLDHRNLWIASWGYLPGAGLVVGGFLASADASTPTTTTVGRVLIASGVTLVGIVLRVRLTHNGEAASP